MDYIKLFDLGQPTFYIYIGDERSFDHIYLQLSIKYKNSIIRMIRGKKSEIVSSFFNEAAAALQFPYYFGENGAAFNDCITDLSWLEGNAYLLMIRNANSLLREDDRGFNWVMETLSDANKDWLNPNQFNPRDLPPTPFHVLFHCNSSEVSEFSQRLSNMNVEFEILQPEDD